MKTITLDLTSIDGNAFALLSAFKKQAKREGWTPEEIDSVIKEATAEDYDNLLKVLIRHTTHE